MASDNSNDEIEFVIFHKLLDVVPDLLTTEESGKSKRDGYMDLGLDILSRTPDKLVIALSHYYRHPSGDMIADPDMEIAVYSQQERARAVTYQDTFGYQTVDLCSGDEARKCQRDLNKFLSQWLGNLIMQGHQITTKLRPSLYINDVEISY